MTIVPCETPAQAHRVVEMCLRYLDETPYGEIVGKGDPEAIARIVAFAMTNGVILLAVTPSGAVVGFIGLVAMTHPIADVLYADELAWWVEPEHRAGRAGYMLLRSAERWARQVGCKMLKVVASADNMRVGDFLSHHGFVAVETAFQKRWA